jgi:tetratricopeptide (TPR) repeat protein
MLRRAMSSTAVAAPRSPWIIGRVDDLMLFVATPVLILIGALLLRQVSDSRTIQYGIVAFGSLGHNLPGMMRAYGDRALFRRFRTRFLVAPVAFVGASIAFVVTGSGGLVLIAYLWSIWHALMQVYGFLRIYDGRLGITATRIARLDLAMCIAWFGGAVVFSDARLFVIQSIAAEFGVGPMSPATLHVVRQGAVAVIGVVTLAYSAGLLRDWRAGAPISWLKNLLYLTSIGFWWYAQVGVADVLLGLVLFEAFHDVQYLAIVWVFNRRRAQQPDAGASTRFLFRRSPAMVLLYVGLCLAYGGLLPVAQSVETSAATQVAIASAVQCSALLHYYYDGFLWKVRERSTQQALGFQGNGGRPDAVVTWHGIKWLVLAAPAAGLWFATGNPIGLAEAEALAASTPNAAEAHHRLGTARTEAGWPREAVESLERALSITPGDAPTEADLALAKLAVGLDLLRARRVGEAAPWLAAAVARLPSLVERAITAASECHRQGRKDEAIVHLHAAAIMAPGMAAAHLDLALLLRDAGRREEALQQARLGVDLVPGDARAQALVRELEAPR